MKDDEYERLLTIHLVAFQDRAAEYVTIPMLPQKSKPPAGTLVWELPKRAVAAAGVGVDGSVRLTLPIAVITELSELRAPAFADMFAGAMRP
ncbi:MAG: hypothetical protein DLM66_03690 [Candidatus Dormiibacter spiritus]|nr:MAG: hypothetical protein DLM66_03690 [Candidatus Dormibacteraeota bacterium]